MSAILPLSRINLGAGLVSESPDCRWFHSIAPSANRARAVSEPAVPAPLVQSTGTVNVDAPVTVTVRLPSIVVVEFEPVISTLWPVTSPCGLVVVTTVGLAAELDAMVRAVRMLRAVRVMACGIVVASIWPEVHFPAVPAPVTLTGMEKWSAST